MDRFDFHDRWHTSTCGQRIALGVAALLLRGAARGVDIVKICVDDNLGTARKMAPEV